MKKLFLIIFVLTIKLSLAGDTTVIKEFRIAPNDAFSFGERLSFEVSYGFITAAEAFMTISPSAFNYNGRDTYELNFDVNSRSSFDIVYKVRDNYKSYIDKQGIFPWRYEHHIRENDYKRDFEGTFIQESLKVYTKINYKEDKNYKTPAYCQDLVSSLYYARTLDWRNAKEGDVMTVNYFYNDKVMPLKIKFNGREDVDVSAGEFKTFILQPLLSEGFTSKTSDIYVWLTDDDRKIPVKVKMKIVIGSLVAELTKYEGLNGPLNAKQ